MFAIVSALLHWLLSWFRPNEELVLENLALRHQIAVLRRQAHKPRLGRTVVLGGPEKMVAKLACHIDPLPTRDRHRLATSRVLDVLAMEVPPAV